MAKASKPSAFRRICFWLPKLWRDRFARVLQTDGRPQGAFIRDALCRAIEHEEARLVPPLKKI